MMKVENAKKSNMAERVVRTAPEGACTFKVHGHRGLVEKHLSKDGKS